MAKLLFVLFGLLTLSVNWRKTEEPRVITTIETPSSLVSPTPDRVQAKEIDKTATETDLEKRPAHFFVDGKELFVDGFTIQKLVRKERADFYEQRNDPRNVAEIEYVVVKKRKRVLARFDAGLSHPLGSRANFGLFPFLGGGSQQVFISQDVPRGGYQCGQLVAAVSRNLRRASA